MKITLRTHLQVEIGRKLRFVSPQLFQLVHHLHTRTDTPVHEAVRAVYDTLLVQTRKLLYHSFRIIRVEYGDDASSKSGSTLTGFMIKATGDLALDTFSL